MAILMYWRESFCIPPTSIDNEFVYADDAKRVLHPRTPELRASLKYARLSLIYREDLSMVHDLTRTDRHNASLQNERRRMLAYSLLSSHVSMLCGLMQMWISSQIL